MEEGQAITETVRRALREGPFAMRQLAADSGLSYDVLRSWRSGRRRPNPESVRKLADGLARRSESLRELSRELRRFVPQSGQSQGSQGSTQPQSGQTTPGGQAPPSGQQPQSGTPSQQAPAVPPGFQGGA